MKRNPNAIKEGPSRTVFVIFNTAFLGILCLLCILPFLHLLAVSLSSKSAVTAGRVWVVPIGFTLNAYRYLIGQREFFVAFGYSLLRVVLGTSLSVFVTALMAYPLAFAGKKLAGRKAYLVLVIGSMFFSGGLIPTYIVITDLGLYNSIWALILPSAMNCWNMILFVNFFRQVPREMLEAATLDGAGHFTRLFRIVLPTSAPVVATVVLLCAVGHWNAWFDGYLYMNIDKWPLQTYIYHMMEEMKNFQLNKDKMTAEELAVLSQQNDMTLRSAQIFIAMIPVLCVYPIAQKYFVKGILLGGVKE